MSPRYARVRPDVTVDEAISYLRIQARERLETLYVVYVIDADQRLLGVVSFRELFVSPAGRLVREVISIERYDALAANAGRALADAGVTNVRIVVGDGSEGLPSEAPFDGIIVTAGAPSIPETLKTQLGEGGRLVIPVGPAHHQILTIVTRSGNTYTTESNSACSFVPLVGRFGWPS